MRKKLFVTLAAVFAALGLLMGLVACGSAKTYDITFAAEDGTTIATVTVEKGEIPVYDGTEPVKASTPAYSYTFAGWKDADGIIHTGDLPAAEADATYTAAFTQTERTYTVKWDVNGTVTSKVYKYGEAVSYEGATPEKTADAQYTYTFSGWSDGEETYTELPTASKDVTYTAQFTETLNSYTVTWHVGSETSTSTVNYGEKAAYDGTPSKTQTNDKTYTFAGWAATENGDVLDDDELTVTENRDLYAIFTEADRKYTVKFVDEDGTSELYTAQLNYNAVPAYVGEEPTKAKTAQYTYTFKGWKYDGTDYGKSENLPAVHGDMTFVAQYTQTVNKYTVTWSINGTTETEQVEYGATPAYAKGTPEKADDTDYSYEFDGWAATDGGTKLETLPTVTGDVTYYARFNQVTRKYTVTWHIGEKTTTSRVEKNSAPAYEGETPVKTATVDKIFPFTGWSKTDGGEVVTLTEEKITGDTDYYAVFGEETRKYTITFVIDGDENPQDVDYNTKPSYKGEVKKDSSVSHDFTFRAWLDEEGEEHSNEELPEVTGDATYTAVFDETLRKYTITIKHYEGLEGTTQFNDMADDTFTLDYGTILTVENTKAFTAQEKGDKHYLPDMFRIGGRVEGNKEYVVRYTEADTWDGSAKSDHLEGKGDSAEDPFLIKSAADLYYLADVSNNKAYGAGQYYKLTKSIDLGGHEWKPICYANGNGTWRYFEGNFDGGGYTVAGMTCNKPTEKGCGLFACVHNGEIKNLVVQGSIIVESRAGGLAYFSDNEKITNIKTFVDITINSVTNEVYSGGVIGTTTVQNKTSYITDCENYGKLTTTGKRIGGIIGNEGNNNTPAANVVISDCNNYGDITSGTHSGGIVGETESGLLTVTNCNNYGTMTATTTRAGGIVGTIMGAQAKTIENCNNYGKINAPTDSGGIAGYISNATVSGCTNYGEVHAGTSKAGGIAGNAGTSTVSGCKNYGNVTGDQHLGGIIGDTATVNVTECINYGDVTGSMVVDKANVGYAGIVGWTTTSSNVTKCTNYGNVEGNSNTGGICGYLGAGSKCPIEGENVNTNYGNVTGNSAKGNLIGFSNEPTCPAG